MSDRILDLIIQNSDRHLDALLYDNAEYRRIEREISRGFQSRAVDRLLSAYNAESACCYRLVYEQGFKDCISLLKEIGAA